MSGSSVDILTSLINSFAHDNRSSHMDRYYLAVDCGTASVRCGLVSDNGTLICKHSEPISIFNPKPDYYNQSSENIWHQTCVVIRKVIEIAKSPKHNIRDISQKIYGIGFDATCSLVLLDQNYEPVCKENIILWMDHRAIQEAEYINHTCAQNSSLLNDENDVNVLKYVGGKISCEMEIPKILWLKRNAPELYARIAHFMDLTDFLTFKATNNDMRSVCTLTCKWTLLSHKLTPITNTNANASTNTAEEAKDDNTNNVVDNGIDNGNGKYYELRNGWCDEFFACIGFKDLIDSEFKQFGAYAGDIGMSLKNGLSEKASIELNGCVLPGTAIAVGMIDAHCGAIGLLGGQLSESGHSDINRIPFENRIALISGTSTCHMMPINQEPPVFVPGIWGPYYSALIPGLWLLEGGQSSTGSLIDYVTHSFACYKEMQQRSADGLDNNVYAYMNKNLERLRMERNLVDVSLLTRDLHINPYFHGNRSPLSNPDLNGMMVGCKLNDFMSIDKCCVYYLATLQAICYDSKFILDTITANGKQVTSVEQNERVNNQIEIKCVFCTGGLSKNALFVKLHTDITQIPLVLPECEDSTLIGGAVLAYLADQNRERNGGVGFREAMQRMNKAKCVVKPVQNESVIAFHRCKYQVFRRMIEHFDEYTNIMQQCETDSQN